MSVSEDDSDAGSEPIRKKKSLKRKKGKSEKMGEKKSAEESKNGSVETAKKEDG